MTNAQIIFNESLKLAEAGIIGTTGRVLELVDGAGNKTAVQEPETIHTYAAWKSLGFQVKKGSKAVASFTIWKHTTKKSRNDDGEEQEQENMFMTKASFFTIGQCEKATVTA